MTVKYGNVMAAFLVVFVLCIPVINTLKANRYWAFNHFHVLRSTNSVLDKLMRKSLISETLVSRMRNFVCVVYLNHSTALQVALWASVFIALCSVDVCGGDLIFLSKRLGRLCVVSLPTVFFLTLRPSPLPRTLYLSLLPIHKWLSRAVVVLAIMHTIIYCLYFMRNNTVKKTWKPANLFGWAALFGFFLIAITSLLRFRDRSFKVFFFNHYFWSWVVVLCLPFHVRPVNTTYANIANVTLLVYQIFARVRMTLVVSQKGDIKVVDVSPNMAVIEFPNLWIKDRANNPGAHIRITNWHPNFLVRWFKFLIPNYHPYTLVTLPLDRYQRLVVKKSAFKWESNRRYICYGTFDPKLLFIESSNTASLKFSISATSIKAKKLLVVVGGSAISFAIPIIRVANYHAVAIKVVWVLRDYRDLSVLRCFEGLLHGDEFEIFVTGSAGIETKSAITQTSYGTFNSTLKSFRPDLEQNESLRLVLGSLGEGSDQEEDVDVDFVETENPTSQEECQNLTVDNILLDSNSLRSQTSNEFRIDGFQDYVSSMNHVSSAMSRKSSGSAFNEQFVPHLDSSNACDNDYLRTVQNLHLEHRIYRGRPVLNFRYYNWCLTANDTFTQCSGPVLEEGNLVCCKDLGGRHFKSSEQSSAHLDNVWVISAGPKALVKNSRLWANENGLKYHEEAFYV